MSTNVSKQTMDDYIDTVFKEIKARRLSFTYPSLKVRSTFAQPSLKVCDDEVMGDCRVLYF